MAQYDIENFLADLETTVKANLNAAIAAITAEKNDSVVLKAVDASGYRCQTLDGKVANVDPLVFYGIDGVTTDSAGPEVAEKYSCFLVIIVADNGQDLNIHKRLLRYGRALKQVCKDQWDTIAKGLRISIEGLAPIAFRLVDTSEDCRAIGVSIQVTIA